MIVEDDDLPTDTVIVAAINGPDGIDYDPVNNSLIISRNDPSGSDKNFKRLDSNGVLHDWTTLSGLPNAGEIKVGVVQGTANGWTQGDMYFCTGQAGKIGRISADGSTVT